MARKPHPSVFRATPKSHRPPCPVCGYQLVPGLACEWCVMTEMEKDPLHVYLLPAGKIPSIGPERGFSVFNGIVRYTSANGSSRYVLYRSGRPLAGLQVVSSDGRTATIANVYTRPDFRRKGLASQLLDRARADFDSVSHAEERHMSEDGRAWAAARNPPWGSSYKFIGTEEILDAVREAEPSDEYVTPIDRSSYRPRDIHPAGKVTWIGSKGYCVRIPAKNVLFMEGNLWYPGHAAALVEGIRDGSNRILEVPAGRVYRVTASHVKQSEKYERDGELEYQLGMVEPWTKAEIGEYYAQLLDGNHRAAAALVAGDQEIVVYVAENTRENVYKKDLE